MEKEGKPAAAQPTETRPPLDTEEAFEERAEMSRKRSLEMPCATCNGTGKVARAAAPVGPPELCDQCGKPLDVHVRRQMTSDPASEPCEFTATEPVEPAPRTPTVGECQYKLVEVILRAGENPSPRQHSEIDEAFDNLTRAIETPSPRAASSPVVRPQADAEQRIHNAYEVYANMEGFLPATAPEAYLMQVISDMVKELKG